MKFSKTINSLFVVLAFIMTNTISAQGNSNNGASTTQSAFVNDNGNNGNAGNGNSGNGLGNNPYGNQGSNGTSNGRTGGAKVPLDGGLSILLLGAAAFGIKKLRNKE